MKASYEQLRKPDYKQGDFVPYPCLEGCNHQFRLKKDLAGLNQEAIIYLECPNCGREKKITVREAKKIINSRYLLE